MFAFFGFTLFARVVELVCSSRAESRCSQRQQKALSSAVHRLSEALKELQRENALLREELSTDAPAGGLKGANTLGMDALNRATEMLTPEPSPRLQRVE